MWEQYDLDGIEPVDRKTLIRLEENKWIELGKSICVWTIPQAYIMFKYEEKRSCVLFKSNFGDDIVKKARLFDELERSGGS